MNLIYYGKAIQNYWLSIITKVQSYEQSNSSL